MYTALLHIHSLLRWVAVILLVATIVDSLVRMYKPFNENDKKLALFAMISIHTQLLVGFILYGLRVGYWVEHANGLVMKVAESRFWVVEHLLGMLLGVTFITIGYVRAKRQSEKWAKHRMIFIYYLIGFILIMASIPWAFRAEGIARPWF